MAYLFSFLNGFQVRRLAYVLAIMYLIKNSYFRLYLDFYYSAQKQSAKTELGPTYEIFNIERHLIYGIFIKCD